MGKHIIDPKSSEICKFFKFFLVGCKLYAVNCEVFVALNVRKNIILNDFTPIYFPKNG
jgi:hypothetical protein